MSSSNDSNKAEDASDSPDDPLVEVPRLGGTFELVKKSHITRMDVKGMLIRCTSCLHQINHFDPDKFMKHFRLNVIVCKECYDFYGTSEFSQDDEGNYNYCAWCGNGGKLFLCDFCPNSFCSTCVRRNFGRAEVSKMSREGWKCYLCNPQKLKPKAEFCDLILEYSKNLKNGKEKKSAAENLISKISGPLSWTETTDWVLPAFDELDDSCKTFHKRLEKLKSIGSNQSKSLKHVIKKMEQVITQHKTELGQIIKTLSMRYVKYLDQKMKLENKNDSDSKDIKENGADGEETRISIDITSDNDENNKAKLELLAFSLSSDSDSENENKSAVEEKDDGNSVTNNSNKATEKVVKNAKPDFLKDKEEGKSSDNEEPMEVDDTNLQSQDLFENGTSDTEEAKKPVISIVDDSDHVETETQSKASKPKCSVTSKAKAAQPGRRKLNFADLESMDTGDGSSSVSGLDSDAEGNRKKQIKDKASPTKARNVARRTKKVEPFDLHNDSKFKNGCSVVLHKCDHLVPNGEMTIPLPEDYIIEDVDKEIIDLCKSITKNQRVESKAKPAPSFKKKESGSKKKAVIISGSSSSSICLSSDEDEKKETKDRFPKSLKMEDKNTLAKKALLDSDSEESSDPLDSGSDEEAPKKKTNQKKENKVKSDSSDDFQPKKKKKFDKLLNKKIFSDDDSSKDNDKEKEKKQTEKKKSSKRKHVSSEEDKKEKKEKEKNNSDSVRTSSSDSEDEKEKKKKKRKRIKKAAASSSENEEKDDKDPKASQGTPGKHRKNIKKIITGKNLAVETKEAQNAEKERRKRVIARQKQYNIITDTSKDGTHAITRKMVLEVDQVSKEEIVEVHPELCEKLKPHQVNGVRFMWECTIESLKELETGLGSGCILAHCMGLGKTLQVITFLHTCLTNEHVNKKIQTALIICPYNTILNWAREFEYWLDKVDGDVLVHQLTDGKDNYSRLDILKYWQRDGGVLIASYDIFRRMATEKKLPKLPKKSMEKLREILIDPGPDIVVCDEGHILKNVNSAISKACAKIATERRIVLTGTPLQNNLQEYHCMLSFVKPHLLGTAKEFRNRFVNPIINGQYEDSNEYDVRRMKKRIHILHKLLEGCVQRCDYSALTKFLPPKHEYVISVKCSEAQIKMYRHYLDNLSQRKADRKIQGGTLFADYNVLRNLCTHPYIVHTSYERAEERRMMNGDSSEEEFINDESEESAKGSKSGSESSEDEVVKQYKTRSRKNETGDEEEEEVAEATKDKRWYHEFISDEDRYRLDLSGKMVLLMEILKECEAIGDKVILFSQSLLTLDLVEDILNHVDDQELSEEDKARDISCTWVEGLDYFRMDGTTSAELRKRFIDMFNSPDNDRARLFLVSTKAGGLGTNLVGANRVIMLDASWNPSHDVQAIFRVYRFGQKKPVYIYRLLAQGTMEEKIYDRQVTKLSLSIRVVDEQQIDRHFNAAELAELYNFTPDSTTDRPTPMLPKDTLLAEMLIKYNDWIVTYHEHDSLLQNENEEDLTEEERQAAWNEYENEREGRTTMYENNVDADISEYGKEPDYTQADYVGTLIPSSKDMIESIISNLKSKFPNFGPVDLRKKLLISLHTLRQMFQEKHVKLLRIKQEFVARGSVPSTINKYLQELNRVLEELSKHCENIQKLVQQDYVQMQEEMARRAQASRAAQAAAQANHAANLGQQGMPYRANMNFASSRLPNGVNQFPPFVRMNQNLQARMSQFPGGPHPELKYYLRDPDFTKDDYGRPIIPSTRFMVERLEKHIQEKFSEFSTKQAVDMFMQSVVKLFDMFQMKYVEVFGVLPGQYVPYGIKPGAVNKYLLELDRVTKELTHVQREMAKKWQEKVLANPGLVNGTSGRISEVTPESMKLPYVAATSSKLPVALESTTLPEVALGFKEIPDDSRRARKKFNVDSNSSEDSDVSRESEKEHDSEPKTRRKSNVGPKPKEKHVDASESETESYVPPRTRRMLEAAPETMTEKNLVFAPKSKKESYSLPKTRRKNDTTVESTKQLDVSPESKKGRAFARVTRRKSDVVEISTKESVVASQSKNESDNASETRRRYGRALKELDVSPESKKKMDPATKNQKSVFALEPTAKSEVTLDSRKKPDAIPKTRRKSITSHKSTPQVAFKSEEERYPIAKTQRKPITVPKSTKKLKVSLESKKEPEVAFETKKETDGASRTRKKSVTVPESAQKAKLVPESKKEHDVAFESEKEHDLASRTRRKLVTVPKPAEKTKLVPLPKEESNSSLKSPGKSDVTRNLKKKQKYALKSKPAYATRSRRQNH